MLFKYLYKNFIYILRDWYRFHVIFHVSIYFRLLFLTLKSISLYFVTYEEEVIKNWNDSNCTFNVEIIFLPFLRF